MQRHDYVIALCMHIHRNYLSGSWREDVDAPGRFKLCQELFLAASRKDIPYLEDLVAFYDGPEVMYQIAIEHGYR